MQEDLCPALARNAAALTLIAAERAKDAENPTLKSMENLLCEASKLMANAIWQETESRKTLVSPVFAPQVRLAMKKAETTTKLFGDRTVELAKEQVELKSILTTERSRANRGGFTQNFFRKGPYNRPFPPPTYAQMGAPQFPYPHQYPSNAAVPTRPQLSLRGKRGAYQPFNPRPSRPGLGRGAMKK